MTTRASEFHGLAIGVEHAFRGKVNFVIEDRAAVVDPLAVGIVEHRHERGAMFLVNSFISHERELGVPRRAFIERNDLRSEMRFGTRHGP